MKAANTKTYVVDASYVLSFLMADEGSKEVDDFFDLYTKGVIQCSSSSILSLEVLNALVMASRRKRVTEAQAKELAQKFLALQISLDVSDYAQCMSAALNYSITVYDASYLVLAQREGIQLKTHDSQLKKIIAR